MSHRYVNEVRDEAERQLREERFKQLVEQEKERLRKRKHVPLWHRIFPFTIKIERR